MSRGLTRLLLPQTLGLNLFLTLGFIGAATAWRVGWLTVVLILLAFVGARNTGHAFNQIVDMRLDRRNPRTQDRPLVTGEMRLSTAYLVVVLNAALVVVASALLNPLVLLLSPVALLLVMGYSYTKRFTTWTTVVLGLVQSMVPVAIYLATREALPLAAVVGGVSVLLFGTAFETVHSLGDVDSDRRLGLHSIPVRLGRRRSVRLTALLLGLSLLSFGAYAFLVPLGAGFLIGLAGMSGFAAWEVGTLVTEKAPIRRVFPANFAFAGMFLAAVVLGTFLGPSL